MQLGPLNYVYYWTADMDRAVHFYEDVLGLKLLRRDDSQWAEFDAGSVKFSLHGAVDGRPVEPGGATAVFLVDDLDLTKAALQDRGAVFDEHVGEVKGFARFAALHDPDGNKIELIEYEREPGGMS